MPNNQQLSAELDLLRLFNLDSSDAGLKVHSSEASEESVKAARRLYEKQLVSQPDGGYLTPMGREAAEHLQRALSILTPG